MKTTDRLPGETARAYEAARCYFEMGAERSLRATAQKLCKNATTVAHWSKKHAWVPRAAQFDYEQAQARQKAEQRALATEAEKWALRQAQLREDAWNEAGKLLERVRVLLDSPLAETRELRDGVTVITKPMKWTFGDIPRALEVIDKLRRLAAGLPTQRTETSGPDGGPIKTEVKAEVEVVKIPFKPAHAKRVFKDAIRREIEAEMKFKKGATA